MFLVVACYECFRNRGDDDDEDGEKGGSWSVLRANNELAADKDIIILILGARKQGGRTLPHDT